MIDLNEGKERTREWRRGGIRGTVVPEVKRKIMRLLLAVILPRLRRKYHEVKGKQWESERAQGPTTTATTSDHVVQLIDSAWCDCIMFESFYTPWMELQYPIRARKKYTKGGILVQLPRSVWHGGGDWWGGWDGGLDPIKKTPVKQSRSNSEAEKREGKKHHKTGYYYCDATQRSTTWSSGVLNFNEKLALLFFRSVFMLDHVISCQDVDVNHSQYRIGQLSLRTDLPLGKRVGTTT